METLAHPEAGDRLDALTTSVDGHDVLLVLTSEVLYLSELGEDTILRVIPLHNVVDVEYERPASRWKMMLAGIVTALSGIWPIGISAELFGAIASFLFMVGCAMVLVGLAVTLVAFGRDKAVLTIRTAGGELSASASEAASTGMLALIGSALADHSRRSDINQSSSRFAP